MSSNARTPHDTGFVDKSDGERDEEDDRDGGVRTSHRNIVRPAILQSAGLETTQRRQDDTRKKTKTTQR